MPLAASAAGFGLATEGGAGGGGTPEGIGLTGAPRGVLPRSFPLGAALAAPAVIPTNGSSLPLAAPPPVVIGAIVTLYGGGSIGGDGTLRPSYFALMAARRADSSGDGIG